MPEFKPPLTLEELKQIQEKHGDDPTVLRLLWEIKRLHTIVRRQYQLVQTVKPNPRGTADQIIAAAAWEQIKDDPVVKDVDERHRQIFEQQTKPGDDDKEE